MKEALNSFELLIETVILVLLIIIDTFILYMLSCFNPYYGQNSSDHAAELLVVIDKIQSISDKIAEYVNAMNSENFSEFNKHMETINLLYNDYVVNLNKIHYFLWHIIVHS